MTLMVQKSPEQRLMVEGRITFISSLVSLCLAGREPWLPLMIGSTKVHATSRVAI